MRKMQRFPEGPELIPQHRSGHHHCLLRARRTAGELQEDSVSRSRFCAVFSSLHGFDPQGNESLFELLRILYRTAVVE